jgi:hypothetical protein
MTLPYSKKDKAIIGYTLILAGVLALACMVIGLYATQFDSEAFSNPLSLLDKSNVDPLLLRWFMLFDLFGYYLLLLPFVFYAHHTLKSKTPWADFFSNMGFAYVLIGAIGAAALAVIWPSIVEQYPTANETTREILRGNFSLATDFVVKGLWNYLEVLLGGIWWIGIGVFLFESPSLKVTSVILGCACIMDSVGELFAIPMLAEIGLNVYLVLGIVWPIWLGAKMVRTEG